MRVRQLRVCFGECGWVLTGFLPGCDDLPNVESGEGHRGPPPLPTNEENSGDPRHTDRFLEELYYAGGPVLVSAVLEFTLEVRVELFGYQDGSLD